MSSCFLGIVAMPTDRVLPHSQARDDNAELEVIDVGPQEPVKILETQGTFEEMIVWGHEILPAADDSIVKGVEEWIRFAETVCPFTRLVFWTQPDSFSLYRCTRRLHQIRMARISDF